MTSPEKIKSLYDLEALKCQAKAASLLGDLNIAILNDCGHLNQDYIRACKGQIKI